MYSFGRLDSVEGKTTSKPVSYRRRDLRTGEERFGTPSPLKKVPEPGASPSPSTTSSPSTHLNDAAHHSSQAEDMDVLGELPNTKEKRSNLSFFNPSYYEAQDMTETTEVKDLKESATPPTTETTRSNASSSSAASHNINNSTSNLQRSTGYFSGVMEVDEKRSYDVHYDKATDDLGDVQLKSYVKMEEEIRIPQRIDVCEVVTINVSGTRFETSPKLLESIPGTRISRLTPKHESYNPRTDEYVFFRNAEVFRYVLDFFHSGEMHLPQAMCYRTVRAELEYWNIDTDYVEECCNEGFNRLEDEKDELEQLQNAFEHSWNVDDEESVGEKIDSGLRNWKHWVWELLEEVNTRQGKIWSLVRFLLAVLSWLTYVAETNEIFRVDNTILKNSTAKGILMSQVQNNTKLFMHYHTTVMIPVLFIDGVTAFLFFLELLFRFYLTPVRRQFFVYSTMNIIDTICVSADICKLILYIVSTQIDLLHTSDTGQLVLIYVYGAMSVFRVIRMVRILKSADKYSNIRVLRLAMAVSMPEVVLLVLVMLLGMVVYGSIIYVAEISTATMFEDLIDSCWWAIITMTTVGYGDQTPSSVQGRFIGMACAITGVVFISLPIPIIANNFGRYYRYAQDQKKALKRSELKKGRDLGQEVSVIRTDQNDIGNKY